MPTDFSELRSRAVSLALRSAIHGLSRAGSLVPHANPARYGIKVLRDQSYGAHRVGHLYDVYVPGEPRPDRAVVLHIHGGGFRVLSKDTHWLMALLFAREGYVVFNINYRLAPRHPFPAAVEDCADAYVEVLRRAPEFGGNPENLVVAGESAGGNLTLAVTLMSCFARDEAFARKVYDTGVTPRAAVPFCGMLETSDPESICRGVESEFIHERVRGVSSVYLDGRRPDVSLDFADPLAWLEEGEAPERPLPPMFAPCGTNDPLLVHTRRLQRAMAKRGVRCEAPEFAGGLHGFHAMYWTTNAQRAWQETFAFLDATLD